MTIIIKDIDFEKSLRIEVDLIKNKLTKFFIIGRSLSSDDKDIFIDCCLSVSDLMAKSISDLKTYADIASVFS
jgi:hypothetical protein